MTRPQTKQVNQLLWSMFGTIQLAVIGIMLVSIFVTGHYLGEPGKCVLWQLGAAAGGVWSVLVTFKWKLYPKHGVDV